MRLFTAIPLPPLVTDRLSALRLRLPAPRDGLRWSSPEQWHITLQYFGDLQAEECEALRNRVENFPAPDATLRLEALGTFRAKGILYAAVQASEDLSSLRSALGDPVGSRLAPAPASLPFHPHVTLARSKGRIGLRTLQRLSSPSLPRLDPVSWRAQQVCLYQSVLGPQGAQYLLLASTPSPQS